MLRFAILALTLSIAPATSIAQDAQSPYPFTETADLDFFKRDIRSENYSTEFEEELMGRASRNGIVVGVFGGSRIIHERVERTVGQAHRRGIPVAMAIANDDNDLAANATIKVFVGGGVLYRVQAYDLTQNIESELAEMIDDAHVQLQNQRQDQRNE